MSPGDTSEYMRIRHYVMNLIYRSSGKAERLPSISELAKKFSVSRPTVSRAMKVLTSEGFVTGFRGIGAFTNPAKSPICAENLPIVGILTGDGRWVHYERYLGHMFAEMILHVVDMPATAHLLTLPSTEREEMLSSLENEQLDMLLSFGASENTLRGLEEFFEKTHLPVVTVQPEGKTNILPCVSLDYESWGYACGKIFAEEKRKNVFFFPASAPWDSSCKGLERAYTEAGIELNRNLFFPNPHTTGAELEKVLRYGIPADAICSMLPPGGKDLADFLLEINPRLAETCTIARAEFLSRKESPFREILYRIPFSDLMEKAIGMLKSGAEPGTSERIDIPLIERKKSEKSTLK